MSAGTSFVLRQRRGRQVGLVALAAGLVVASLFASGVFDESPKRWDRFDVTPYMLWFGAAFFSIVGVVNLYVFKKNTPVAEFNANGIRLGDGELIPWGKIRKAGRRTQSIRSSGFVVSKQHFLIFDVDPEWEVGLPFYKVWWRDLNHGHSGASHFIGNAATGFSLDCVVARFNEYAPERLRFLDE